MTNDAEPAEILQRLIRFDTTNPPGDEEACVDFVDSLLREAGLATERYTKEPGRPNLVTRLAGRGDAPPLLLYGHVDVVTAEGQEWTHPPFSGAREDGWIWGRGALDMKGGVAMMLSAVLRAARSGLRPAGDVILAVLVDEEAGGDAGARYLVEEHADLFRDVRYAIGEFGGFPMWLGGRKTYPIQVSEKAICWLEATVRGRAGHAALPHSGGTMARLSEVLRRLDGARLPTRVTPAAREMIGSLAEAAGPPVSDTLGGLLDRERTDSILDRMGEEAVLFDGALHDTVNATRVRAGDKINVIPEEARLGLDGRILPGVEPGQFLGEVRDVLGETAEHVELAVDRHDPGPSGEPDMGLFETLADVLREQDPEGEPVPFLLPAVTDARFFDRLGIQTYGFLPMDLPEGFAFLETVHSGDERIPADAVTFGARAIGEVLGRYGEA